MGTLLSNPGFYWHLGHTHKKGCDNDTFRALYPSIWVFWDPQTLQNKGKHKMTNRPCLPPPKNPKYPPPSNEEFYGHRFSCRKNAFFPRAHKIGTAISGPRIADKNFTDTRIFLKHCRCTVVAKMRLRMRMRILTRPEYSLANVGHRILRIAKGAGGKRPRQKTSKIVKKCQKVFRHFSTIFAQGKNVKNRQTASKSSTLFDNFRAAPFCPFGGGGSDKSQKKNCKLSGTYTLLAIANGYANGFANEIAKIS